MGAERPEVAVVVPCWNLGTFLEEALESVACQTRPAAEVVVVDDGSDDPRTLEALACVEAGGVRVVRRPHQGVARARDAGVHATRAPYVLWLDADDRLDPRFLEATAGWLDAHPQADFVATAVRAFGEEQFTWQPPEPDDLVAHLAEGSYPITALFRRRLWQAVGGCDPALPSFEDWDFWLRVLKAGGRGGVLPEPLFRYRTRPGSRRVRSYENDVYAPAMVGLAERHCDLIDQLAPALRVRKEEQLRAQRDRLAALEQRRVALEARLAGPNVEPLGDLAARGTGAVVLAYHRVANLTPDPFGLCTSPATFRAQLEHVAATCRPLSLDALLEAMAEDRVPDRAVAVTLDDGYLDAFEASEILRETGVPATFFVNSGLLGQPRETWEELLSRILLGEGALPATVPLVVDGCRLELACHDAAARRAALDVLYSQGRGLPAAGRAELVAAVVAACGADASPRLSHRLLTAEEVRELASRPGHDVGSHTVHHLSLVERPQDAWQQIGPDKEALEGLVGRPVRAFAYPYGEAPPAAVAAVRAAAFRSGWTVSQGAARPWGDSLVLPRNDVGRLDPAAFEGRLGALLRSVRGSRSLVVAAPVDRGLAPAVARAVRGVPERLQAGLARCLREQVSSEVGLMWLLGAASDPGRLEALLASVQDALAGHAGDEVAAARARLTALRRLLAENRRGCERVADIYRVASPFNRPEDRSPAAFAAYFDQAVAVDEAASVAMYSLGDPGILAAATAEVVAVLERWALLGPARRGLEIGCGTGRILDALAPRLAWIDGVDVSPRMVAAARRRIDRLTNAAVDQTDGRSLATCAPGAYDLVFAMDAWPCVVASGPAVVDALFGEVARVLRPGGDLVILAYSYRGDEALDRQDVRALAARFGFDLRAEGERPFELWDGAAWWLRRRAPADAAGLGPVGEPSP